MLDLTIYKEKGYSAKEISNLLNISTRKVHYLANKQGLNISRKSKYNIQYNRFSELLHTEETYYLLGYLYSDGYINNKKGLINITSKDREILEKLKSLIGDIPISSNKHGSYYIQWYSKKHIEELFKLGCINNKSLILEYPNWINSDLEHHFIRGYFDGDGSIGLYDRKDRTSKRLSITIAGTVSMLNGIKNYIDNKGSIRSLKRISVLSYHGNLSASNFCNMIYSGASIFMQRKYDIYFKGFIPYRHIIESK